ncbi:transporter substrate-binding domain-containing protein [Bradyrhizobium cenepequi]|uniref:transporter substrate-binding domain-containing protein n=1 Tax=Bradyrhizobium cenepequi TaxID=2821403 RepID=UPI001CE27B65|nr:transporter substrate-binding domain-containing protein [Bradyrhizobium cenepequi]MCA6112206.1 transporter substrate-binding domain-containing protein [Bradyrhizobium cenepequi]
MLILTGYSFGTFAQTEDPLASIRKAGQVKVALASVPPYIVMSPGGEARGSSVDLQNIVLKELGLPALTPMLTGWDAMVPGLQARQFDYIGAGLPITEQGCKVLLFSAPYYAAQLGLFVPPGNPKHLTSVADVAHRPDIKISMLSGLGNNRAYALKVGVKADQVMIVPDHQAGAATVSGGRVDAFVGSQFAILNPEEKGLELVVDKQSPVNASAAAFRKEDVAVRDAFNKKLNVLIRQGLIQDLYKKHGIPNGDIEAQLLANLTKASDVVPSCE